MERIHLIISGDVIGVGFRAWTLRQAQGKHLTGWVTNRQDNAVEIVAEGNKLDLTNFAARCRRGPELAVVKSVDLRWENSTSEFVSFDVLY